MSGPASTSRTKSFKKSFKKMSVAASTSRNGNSLDIVENTKTECRVPSEEEEIKRKCINKFKMPLVEDEGKRKKVLDMNFLMGKAASRIPATELQDLTKITHFDADEIKLWYQGFVKDNPSGRLNEEQFVELYSSFYKTENAKKFAEHCFRTFDVNRDGTIDFREFICSMSITTRGNMEEKLKWAFEIYDVDGNGYITKSEMLAIVKSIQKMVGAMDDKNASADKVLHIFEKFDVNKDGKLSLDEFLDGAKKDPTFIKMLQI